MNESRRTPPARPVRASPGPRCPRTCGTPWTTRCVFCIASAVPCCTCTGCPAPRRHSPSGGASSHRAPARRVSLVGRTVVAGDSYLVARPLDGRGTGRPPGGPEPPRARPPPVSHDSRDTEHSRGNSSVRSQHTSIPPHRPLTSLAWAKPSQAPTLL